MLEASLALGHQVTLYPALKPSESWEEAYSDIPREVELMLGQGLAGLAGFLRDRAHGYDTMIVSRPHNMRRVSQALSGLSGNSWPALVYDAEALFALREDRKSTRLNSSHIQKSRMPSSA